MTETAWKLTDDEYEFIKGEVVHIFAKYRIKCIPVSGFEIAARMEITIIAYSKLHGKKLDTALKVSPDGFFFEFYGKEFIIYNDIDCSYERQNWTILHEIGHIVLDHSGNGIHEEAEADFFAKYAIAPPVLIYKIQAKSPEDIFNAFDISYEAAVYSYKYYKKWLSHHQHTVCFTTYELQLLMLCKECERKDSDSLLKEAM